MAELPAMVQQGITSIKCFMAYKGVFQIDDATLFQVLEQARELGAWSTCMPRTAMSWTC